MARLIHHLKLIDEYGSIEERIIWEVPKSEQYPEGIRYRLAYIPKGHHKHLEERKATYDFIGVEKLLEDFRRDIGRLK